MDNSRMKIQMYVKACLDFLGAWIGLIIIKSNYLFYWSFNPNR